MRNWPSRKQIYRSHSITVFTFFHLHFSTCPWWDTHAQVLTGTLKKSRWYCNVQQTSLVGKDQGQKMEVMKPSQNKRSSFKVTSTHCQFETMILILQNSVITIFWCFMKTESLTAILSVCFPCSVWCIWTSETRTNNSQLVFSLCAGNKWFDFCQFSPLYMQSDSHIPSFQNQPPAKYLNN